MKNDNHFDQIDLYLNEELTASDALAFEKAMKVNPDLANALILRRKEWLELSANNPDLYLEEHDDLGVIWKLLTVREIIQDVAQELKIENPAVYSPSEQEEVVVSLSPQSEPEPMLENAEELRLRKAWQDLTIREIASQVQGNSEDKAQPPLTSQLRPFSPQYIWPMAIAASVVFIFLINLPRPGSNQFELNPKTEMGPGADSLEEARQLSMEILASSLSVQSFGWELLPDEQLVLKHSLKQFPRDSVQRANFLLLELQKLDSLSEGGGCLLSLAIAQARPWPESNRTLVQFAKTGQPGGWWVLGVYAIVYEDYPQADTALRMVFEFYPNFPANSLVERILGYLPPSGVGDGME